MSPIDQITPSGPCHTILGRLAEGPAKPRRLMDAVGLPRPARDTPRKKFWRQINYLEGEGLIVERLGDYTITAAGREVLAALDLRAAARALAFQPRAVGASR